MKLEINSLKQSEMKALSQEFEVLTFPNDFELIYENHIPSAGIAIVDGSLELLKKSKVQHVVPSGHVLGIQELLHEKPIPYACRVKANSKVILLGKSKLLEAMKKTSFLSRFLST